MIRTSLSTVSSTGSISTACCVFRQPSKYVYVLDSFSNSWRKIIRLIFFDFWISLCFFYFWTILLDKWAELFIFWIVLEVSIDECPCLRSHLFQNGLEHFTAFDIAIELRDQCFSFDSVAMFGEKIAQLSRQTIIWIQFDFWMVNFAFGAR